MNSNFFASAILNKKSNYIIKYVINQSPEKSGL